MVNHNNVDNANVQAITTLTRSTRSNKCLKCGKSHAFHREACPDFRSKIQYMRKKQTTGHQYVCQTEQNQNNGQGHKAENTENQNITLNHNIGENSA